MDVDTRDLHFFLVISEELNISRAAERLFVSQPLLSQRLARLESRLGTVLVRRHPKGMSLTAAGSALVPFAERVTREWSDTQALITAQAQRQDDTVVIGLSVPPPRGFLALLRERMAGQHAGTRIVTRRPPWTDPSGGLESGEVDVALLRLPLRPYASLTSRVVALNPVVALLPAAHSQASAETLRFAVLEDEPILAPPMTTGPLHEVAIAGGARSRPPTLAVPVSTMEELLDGVALGVGIALVADSMSQCLPDGIAARPVEDLAPLKTAVAWRMSGVRSIVLDALPAIRQTAEQTLPVASSR